MEHRARSIRPFIGARQYDISCSFYRDLGFEETVLSPMLSVFKSGNFSFYLQNAYVKDWIDNSMIFWKWKTFTAFGMSCRHCNYPPNMKTSNSHPLKKTTGAVNVLYMILQVSSGILENSINNCTATTCTFKE